MLFLTAMVGAVVIGKREEKITPAEDKRQQTVRAAMEVE
jgi:hypothetical protein